MFKLAIAAMVLTLSTGAMAQEHRGGMTGPGQNAPDSRDVRTVDEHMNHGMKSYHGHRVCKVSHRHGHSYRKCWNR